MGNIKLVLQFPPIFTHRHISLSDVESCPMPAVYTGTLHYSWASRGLFLSQGKRKTHTHTQIQKRKRKPNQSKLNVLSANFMNCPQLLIYRHSSRQWQLLQHTSQWSELLHGNSQQAWTYPAQASFRATEGDFQKEQEFLKLRQGIASYLKGRGSIATTVVV